LLRPRRRERKEIETASIQTEVERPASKSREEHIFLGGLIQYQKR
jgi:hypothetical protein